ncbi:MAG: flavocytochrome C [Rhodocyclaceae bacterium]|nr:MAG: flavocytochrome C [Rhodocyclaceae bacterium]
MSISRRQFIQSSAGVAGVATLGALSGCASTATVGQTVTAIKPRISRPKVVIVGAGFGGATCARYIKMWEPHIDVTVIEPNDHFVSCPTSNEVLSGTRKLADITFSYGNLTSIVDTWVKDTMTAIDTDKRVITTAGGKQIAYDRVVLAGGVELLFNTVKGYDAEAQKTVMHAWKAGPQTATLRAQLEAMPDGGVFVMSVPMAPYRCPPGPYERACQVASYFKKAKPRSKIIILDGNPDIASKKGLFLAAWKKHYGHGTPAAMIDYRGNNAPASVNATTKMVGTEFDDVKGDVINVVPKMQAADICAMAKVRLSADGKTPGPWCPIDFRTYESKFVKNVHIIGDSALSNFPKSGSMANNMAKILAASLCEMFNGRDPVDTPVVANTCYSATTDHTAIHVATVFRYNGKNKDGNPIPGGEMVAQSSKGNGLSSEETEIEHAYMEGWAKNVWADTLAL